MYVEGAFPYVGTNDCAVWQDPGPLAVSYSFATTQWPFSVDLHALGFLSGTEFISAGFSFGMLVPDLTTLGGEEDQPLRGSGRGGALVLGASACPATRCTWARWA